MTSTFALSLALSLLLTLSSHSAENVDSCFRAIAHAPPDECSKAVSQLARWLQPGAENQTAAVVSYAWDSARRTSERTTHSPDREHCKTLLEAVPKLIGTLRTDQRKDAWAILIRVTPNCAGTTDYDFWHKWWESEGHKFFTMLAAQR